jgi:3-phenylpropionate/cinnamic acid dioxygenase small subunit
MGIESMSSLVLTSPALRSELEDFYAYYLQAIDQKRPNDWVDMFVEEGLYAVSTHNNTSTTGLWWYTDRGRLALKERAAYTNGYFWHSPTKTLHTFTNLRAQERDDGMISAHAYFVMYTADRGELSELYVCGEYDDLFTRVEGELRFAEHRVIIDSETVPPNMGVLL